MKTLNTIQTLSKIGRILSKIVSIFCIVGFAICITAFVPVFIMGKNVFTFGGITLKNIISDYRPYSVGSVCFALANGAILCAGEAVLAQFAAHYFDRELKDGTPFTLEGANELFRLGILAIAIPLVTRLTSEFAETILNAVYVGDVYPMFTATYSPALLGAAFIFASLLCRLGAENKC